jgi:PKD repeat protein
MKLKFLHLSFLCCLIFFSGKVILAQSFTKITDSPLVKDGMESEGCAWGDIDNDGDEDLIVTNGMQNAQNNILFLNEGPDSSYTFSRIDEGHVVNDGAGSRAPSWGDYDNDGDLDLIVTNQRKFWNSFLYQNNGDGTFAEINNTPVIKDPCYSDPGGWIDYDHDGYLDIFVGNPDPGWALNNLYHNEGAGIFTKNRTSAIVNGNTQGFAWGDYDNDGDEDLFTIEANGDRLLFDNDGNGNFSQISGSVITEGLGGAHGNWVDYDNDGDYDLYDPWKGLFMNLGADSSYSFRKILSDDIPQYDNPYLISTWVDMDNDGDVDCYISRLGSNRLANVLFTNNGDGTFTEITEGEIVTETSYSTGCAWADYDNDGDMDLYVCNTFNDNNLLYRNENDNGNSWLKIKLAGTVSNASAIGAKIKVKANTGAGAVWQIRSIEGQSTLMSQNSLIAHFGLGSATVVDSLVIGWPAGHETIITSVDINQKLTITEDIPGDFIRARFTADTLYGPGTLTVQFNDKSLSNGTDTVSSWSWDFDNDGVEDSGEKNPIHTFNSTEGRYYDVRLVVSNGITSDSVLKKDYVRIYPGDGNLALWGTATASSSHYNYPVWYANNDDINTGWMSEKRPDSEWLTIGLDTVYTVGKVVLHWYADWRIGHYAIFTSLDNTSWDTVYCLSDASGSTDTLLFTGIDAKYVLLFKFPNPARELFVKEMEIFRSDGNVYPEVKCEPTGIENSLLNILNTTIYPNPIENIVNIDFDQQLNQNTFVELTDITGRVHKKLELATGSSRTTIDVSGLANGIYFLSIRFNDKVYYYKIIK